MILFLLWGAEAPAALQTELTPQQIELVRLKKNLLLGCMQGGRMHSINRQNIPVFHHNWVTVDNFPSVYTEIQLGHFEGQAEEDYAHEQGYTNIEGTKYMRPNIVYDLSNPHNLFAPLQNSLEVVVSEGLLQNLITEDLVDNVRYALQEGGWLIFLGFDPEDTRIPIPMHGFQRIGLGEQLKHDRELVGIFKDLKIYGTSEMPYYAYRKR